jgi:hypothetical protein
MNLPTYTRTKREALALAADIFPTPRIAMERIANDPKRQQYPFYHIDDQAVRDWREILEWLFDDKTRIYKRARWHLFYELTERFTRLMSENKEARDLYWRRRAWDEEFSLKRRASLMAGDGEGI